MTYSSSNRRSRPLLAFLVAVGSSALIWALSPWLTGHAEPWDADGIYYLAALGVAGLVSGALMPRPLWVQYPGAVLGQLAYEAVFLEVGPLFLLGAAFLLGYSLLFVLGAGLAAQVRMRLTGPAA